MPVSADRVAVGTILHFAFAGSGFLSVALFALIRAAAWARLPAVRTRAGMVLAGVAGGAIVYAVNRCAVLPATDPMMRLVPRTASFLAQLLFGLAVGAALAVSLSRHSSRQMLPA